MSTGGTRATRAESRVPTRAGVRTASGGGDYAVGFRDCAFTPDEIAPTVPVAARDVWVNEQDDQTMCGRVRITRPAMAVSELYVAQLTNRQAEMFPPGEYSAGDQVRAISHAEHGGAEITLITWGLPVSWLPSHELLRHARAETVLRKPTFAKSARERRRVIPVDAWYERGTRPGVRRDYHPHRSTRSLKCRPRGTLVAGSFTRRTPAPRHRDEGGAWGAWAHPPPVSNGRPASRGAEMGRPGLPAAYGAPHVGTGIERGGSFRTDLTRGVE